MTELVVSEKLSSLPEDHLMPSYGGLIMLGIPPIQGYRRAS